MLSAARPRAAAQAASALVRLTTAAKPTSVAPFAALAGAHRTLAVASRTARTPAPHRRRGALACVASPSPFCAASRRASSSSSSSSSAPVDHKLWTFAELENLTKQPNSPIVIVDAREPGELQDTGRIPGAINIPVTSGPDSFFVPEEEFEDRFGFARPSPDTEVIFYCKAGVRSRAAASLAKQAGWTNVGEYPGSWLDWTANGGAVER